jgi:hypothetical protein
MGTITDPLPEVVEVCKLISYATRLRETYLYVPNNEVGLSTLHFGCILLNYGFL